MIQVVNDWEVDVAVGDAGAVLDEAVDPIEAPLDAAEEEEEVGLLEERVRSEVQRPMVSAARQRIAMETPYYSYQHSFPYPESPPNLPSRSSDAASTHPLPFGSPSNPSRL